MRRALFLLIFLLVSGCTSGTEPDSGTLLGHWATESEALSPSGSMRHHLVLGRDGRFSAEVRMYGVYPGQSRDALSAFVRHEGDFEAEGDRIHLHAETRTWWDSFYGVAEINVERLSPRTTLYEGAVYRVAGDRLTLVYNSYPLDAPVRTQQTFWRAEG